MVDLNQLFLDNGLLPFVPSSSSNSSMPPPPPPPPQSTGFGWNYVRGGNRWYDDPIDLTPDYPGFGTLGSWQAAWVYQAIILPALIVRGGPIEPAPAYAYPPIPIFNTVAPTSLSTQDRIATTTAATATNGNAAARKLLKRSRKR